MNYLFDPKTLVQAEHWVKEHRPLLGFDFDGTLAPIVKNPIFGTMKKKTRELFVELARCFPCVVISGRGRTDVAGKLPKLKNLTVIGNHGLEWEPALPQALRLEPIVHGWGVTLQEALHRQPHVFVEVKRFSITIHYRKDAGKALILAAVRKHVPGARKIGGKNVINLIPKAALNKGTAFELLRKRMKMPYGLFVGDDVTDQDVFACRPRSTLLTVQVGRPEWSTAKYFMKSQGQIDRLIKMLLTSYPKKT